MGAAFRETKSPKVDVFKDGLLDGFLRVELCEDTLLVFILNYYSAVIGHGIMAGNIAL
jgi:hypothetical protein